ncbi:Ppx/GppA phosphatase family protein [Nitrospirillum pindoramense]|uniref:Exopolyphosphatase/guanosine-5'-triphosphate, 3'-diphosphate pyrophosphatase n=1 Tax=Nitrospirillum amazonense TaxID=28077 RepID=A0A560GNL9_9PROT|nr:Ppx/GppA phosphatase family protein [Nitrospirillum amazonense]TWB35120.1 exopolyphosphatase/guanosine-5'-triphosphate,3'-diphosphate pyrophosphatase [Nitrospirillum amazonense]
MSETGVQPLPETRAPRGAGPGEPLRRPVLAALDLGTNNCRLLIARPGREGFRIIDAFSRIVRLGEGVSRTNALSDEAMARTVAALKICGNKMRRRGVTDLRAVATEACRRAANCGSFIDRVAEETGIRIEIISAEEEARLALAGCAALLNRRIPRALVFDIGGGSTEIMWLSFSRGRPMLIDQVSVPQGVVSLTETFGGDRVLPEAYRGMVDTVGAALADFDARNDIRREVAAGRVQMLGTSGTVTTLAGIRLGLTRYDRSQVDGSWLGLEEARAISKSLLDLDYAGRSAHPCIGHDRADLVIAGCAVLEAIWERWPVENLRIADRGVREGILTELLAATRCPG